MGKWRNGKHSSIIFQKKPFLRWEAVQLDQEGWDPGRCIFARRGFFHLVAENILWEKTFREVLDQNLVKAVLLRCIETISGGGCYIIHITLEKKTFFLPFQSKFSKFISKTFFGMIQPGFQDSERSSQWIWIHFAPGRGEGKINVICQINSIGYWSKGAVRKKIKSVDSSRKRISRIGFSEIHLVWQNVKQGETMAQNLFIFSKEKIEFQFLNKKFNNCPRQTLNFSVFFVILRNLVK